MKSFSAITFLAALSAVSATPVKRAGPTDADILNYALTLEHLEDTFYRTYLAKFNADAFTNAGLGSGVRSRIQQISSDEQTHVAFLTSALKAAGATPVAQCEYSFPVTDPKSFLAVAQILEGVGVSAYLGAAADIASKTYLTDAGAVLTVESRHSAYIRNTNGVSPFPAPFDIPLDLDQVYSLAAPFITSCPKSNPALPVKAFPALSITTAGPYKAGGFITFKLPSSVPKGDLYAAFIQPTNILYKQLNNNKVEIPESTLSGQSYVVITTGTSLSDENTVAGPVSFELA